jgi:prophage maintenance system killer protein
MKHLPTKLREEYDFWSRNNPDIPELAHPLINVSDVLRAYFILINYFTDSSSSDEAENMLVGIRSIDLMISALGRQSISFGCKQKYSRDLQICSTLFFGLVKNHAFADGNKRTSLLVLLYQLDLFSYIPKASTKDFEKLVVCVAEGSLKTKYWKYYKKFKKSTDADILTIEYILRIMVQKKDHSYHISPSMKEFCDALEMQFIKCNLDNAKIHFSYTPKAKWYRKHPKTMHYSIPFGGWTRVVGPKTARDVLKKLDLYDQFASYQEFIDGADPLYELIDKFSEPLRRLKDK